MRDPRSSLEAAFQELQELLSGATLRAIAHIQEMGEVHVVTIGDGSDDVHAVDDRKRDVWTRFTDTLNGLKDVARLFVPAGILWRAPAKGDTGHLVRGRKQRGPGAALIIPDGGDGETENLVPPWFPDDAGMYEPTKDLRVQAVKGAVKIDADDADGKKVFLQGGGKGIARLDDTVNCGWLVFTPNVPPGGAAVLAYLPPDTTPVPTPLLYPAPMVLLTLRGKIDSASQKSETG